MPHARVDRVDRVGGLFMLTTADGRTFSARSVIAATGGFSTAHRPVLPGQASFEGAILHTHEYRSPEPFAGQRVVGSAPATAPSRSPPSWRAWPTSR